MKAVKLLILACIVLHAHSSFAQHNIVLQKELVNKMPKTSLAKASAATGSRLISTMLMRHDGASYVYNDTMHLVYSGTHIGDPSVAVEYDSYTDMLYNTATSAFENYKLYAQTFDANDDITDQVVKAWDGTAYVNDEHHVLTYDGAHNKLTDVEQSWNSTINVWENYQKRSYTYDANNNMLSYTTQNWNSTTLVWDNSYQYTHTYNAANKMTMKIEQYWDIVTSTWKNSWQNTYTYDANNNQLTDNYKQWNAATSTWRNYQLATNTYSAANEMLTEIKQEWNTATSSWDNKSRTTNSSFINTKPQLSIEEMWDNATSSFKNDERTQISYNSYGQYTSIVIDSWNIGGFWQPATNDIKYNLHYEEFATDVKNLAAKGGNAKVYPVPANDRLNIDINWDEPQPFTISLVDLQGRVNRTWQVAATTSYNTAISVNELPFGTYIIRIDGPKGHVVKQLIVSPH